MRSKLRMVGLLALLMAVVGGAGVFIWRLERTSGNTPRPPSPPEPEVDRGRHVVPRTVLELETFGAESLAFSKDGSKIFIAGIEGDLERWDVASEERDLVLAKKTPGARGAFLRLSHDGHLVVGSRVANAAIHDAETGDVRCRFPKQASRVSDIAVSPDDRLVALGQRHGSPAIFRMSDCSKVVALAGPGFTVLFSEDGKTLFTGTVQGPVGAFDAATGEKRFELKGHRGVVTQLARGPKGLIVSSSYDRTVRVWDVASKRSRETFAGHHADLYTLAVSPDGKRLLAGGAMDVLWIRDLTTGALIEKRHARMGKVTSLAFAPDSHSFAVGGRNRYLAIYPVPGLLWQPELPEATHKPVLETLPKPTSPEAAIVQEARRMLDAWPDPPFDRAQLMQKLAAAERLNPKYARLAVAKGRWARKSGYVRRDEYRPGALEAERKLFDEALALDATDAYVHALDMHSRYAMKDFAAAEKAARRAVELAPEDAYANYVLLFVLARNPEVESEKVIELAKKVFSLTKASRIRSGVWASLRKVYGREGDFAAAENSFIAQVRYLPASAWARGNYAEFLVDRSRYREAVRWGTEAVKLMDYGAGRKTLSEAHAGRAIEHALARRIEEAEAALQQAEKAWRPKSARVEVARAVVAYGRGLVDGDLAHVDAAMKMLRDAKRLYPDEPLVQEWLDYHPQMVERVKNH